MTKHKLVSLTETVISKYVSLYKSVTKTGDFTKEYDFISRNHGMTLESGEFGHPNNSNAVAMFVFNRPKTKMLLMKEYRHAANGYVVSTPSGLIDEGETPVEAAIREVYEEVGYTKEDITVDTVLLPSYSSIGISDEQVTSVFMRVNELITPEQHLSLSEDIECFWVTPWDAKYYQENGTFPSRLSEKLGLIENGKPQVICNTARTQMVMKQFVDDNLPNYK